jgi:hypothetical protein
MPDQSPISLFVKLAYWDVYRLNVVLMAILLRKLLYILGFVALLWLALSALLLFRPSTESDWAMIIRNGFPLKWTLVLALLFVFIVPLLAAGRVMRNERVQRGVGYQFSDTGIHLETSVSKTDLSWAAIRRVIELRSAFLVFTSPNIAFMLPRRCFDSAQAVTDLRELFRAKVAKTKLRRD